MTHTLTVYKVTHEWRWRWTRGLCFWLVVRDCHSEGKITAGVKIKKKKLWLLSQENTQIVLTSQQHVQNISENRSDFHRHFSNCLVLLVSVHNENQYSELVWLHHWNTFILFLFHPWSVPSLFTVLFSFSDVCNGSWECCSASYSSGVDFQHQHLPQRFHHGRSRYIVAHL